MMDSLKAKEEISATEVVIYATLSCIVVSFIGILLYLTCSKRYKLNWFENNLLETAKEDEENAQRFVLSSLAVHFAATRRKATRRLIRLSVLIAMKCWFIAECRIITKAQWLEARGH